MHDDDAHPFAILPSSTGEDVPLYLLTFDRGGACTSPKTRDQVLSRLRGGEGFSDLYFFSHGWNNDFPTATARYFDFANGYVHMRKQLQLALQRPHKSMLVGVIWPSTALVLPSEQAPAFAAGGVATEKELSADEAAIVEDFASSLGDSDATRLRTLTRQQRISPTEGRELASLLAPVASRGDADDQPASVDDIAALGVVAPAFDPNAVVGVAQGGAGALQAAGALSLLDPRQLVRMATVRTMKDRAGTVGSADPARLLSSVLESTEVKVHLLGHSYGARVILSAVAAEHRRRPVESVLLLQPAVNRFCFAANVPGTGSPGGYRVVLRDDRVRQPILTTFSKKDLALSRVFHLALRRSTDLGEQQIAADVSPFGALGGFGPGGLGNEAEAMPIKRHPENYIFGAARVVALDGGTKNGLITGHGEISNEATWWALYNQVAAS